MYAVYRAVDVKEFPKKKKGNKASIIVNASFKISVC